MRKLEELSNAELDVRYRIYLHRYECSGGERFENMIEVLKRERGRRYHKTRKPRTAAQKARGEAAQRSAAANFTKGATAARR
jgi:hypothetical protein